MSKFLNILFIALFSSILYGGLIFNELDITIGSISEENRKLKEAPTRPENLEDLKAFPAGFEDYLSDNFTFRPILLKTWNSLLIAIQESPIEKIFIGKQGWLFNNYNDALNQYRGISKMNLKLFIDKLIDDNNYLKEKNIPFIFFIAPNKHSVYSEYLDVKVLDKNRDYDRMYDTLKQFKSDLDFIDLRSFFLEAKKKQDSILLYSPYGTHWSNYGGYLAYTEVMNHIKVYEPDLYILPTDRMKFKKCVGEESLLKQLNAYMGAPDTVNTCMTILKPTKKRIHKLKDVHIHTTDIDNDLTILLIGDSFNLHLTQFYKESFKKIIFTAHNFGNWDRALIDRYNPDIVVYSMVERTLTKKNAEKETMFGFGKED